MQSVVHLSTAYCNIDIECMEEKVYEIDVDPYKIIDIIQWLDSKLLEKISNRYDNFVIILLLKKYTTRYNSMMTRCK